MSIHDCLDTAAAGGEISPRDAARLKARFDDIKTRYADGQTATADAQAKADLLAEMKAETAHKRRMAKLAVARLREIEINISGYRNAKGEPDIGAATLDMLEHFGTAKFASVAGRETAIVGQAHAKMEGFLYHFRQGAALGEKGRWNPADLKKVVREAFGEDSGDPAAKGLAQAWGETAEWLRRSFNDAGGAIGKLENWGLPQAHSQPALMKAGLPTWKATIKPMLDPERMTNPHTGKRVTPRELDAVLDEIYYTITTDGWIKRDPSRQAFGAGALATRHAEHRYLVFRSADDWLKYQEDFGNPDPFATMMSHVGRMAKDIAAMQVLGPNPEGTLNWLRQAIQKEAATKAAGLRGRIPGEGEAAKRAGDKILKRIDDVWGSIRGEMNTPVDGRLANFTAAARNLITASVLGQAAISSFSDVGTQVAARIYAGLPAADVHKSIISAMTPKTRREAVAASLILDSAAHVFQKQARYVGTLNGPEWSAYAADRVLTWSGLTPWTQASRHAFGLAFQTTAADLRHLPFDQLPDAFRNTFARHGIKAQDWEFMRKAKAHTAHNGAELLRPAEIAERAGEKTAMRYLEMILSETEFAVPSGSHRSRTWLISDVRPGTFVGEIIRSFAMFKSFGAVFLLLNGQRVQQLWQGGQRGTATMYAGGLLLSTTMLGAATIQAKQVLAGRDPRDASTPEFWAASALQGGGFGLFGDFLFADINRYGGGPAGAIAGPLIERGAEFWNLTAGNLVQLASGEKTNFGRELVQFAKGNVPGGNIWYVRLAWERLFLDQLQRYADPEAAQAFRRQETRWRNDYGQEFWWRPGQTSPDRAPALGGL